MTKTGRGHPHCPIRFPERYHQRQNFATVCPAIPKKLFNPDRSCPGYLIPSASKGGSRSESGKTQSDKQPRPPGTAPVRPREPRCGPHTLKAGPSPLHQPNARSRAPWANSSKVPSGRFGNFAEPSSSHKKEETLADQITIPKRQQQNHPPGADAALPRQDHPGDVRVPQAGPAHAGGQAESPR